MRNSSGKNDLEMQVAITTEGFSERLSFTLKNSPFSPSKWARKLGVDPRAMSNYYGGSHNPPAAVLVNMMVHSRDVRNLVLQIIEENSGGHITD